MSPVDDRYACLQANESDFHIIVASRNTHSKPQRILGFVTSLCFHLAILSWLSNLLLPRDESPNYPHLICKTNQANQLEHSSADAELQAVHRAAPNMPPIALENTAFQQTSIARPDDAVSSNQPGTVLQSPSEPLGHIIAESPRSLNLRGRHPSRRQQFVARYGGNPLSEAAVERGLKWIISQQHNDGRWSFRLDAGAPVADAGSNGSTTAATSLALLPLLGAGYTHQQGPYQQPIQRALQYLISRMTETPYGGDFQEGTMYGQAFTAIALAETYALSGDAALRPYAQMAVDYICHAQHTAGGWRYRPHEPGDTTVTGWQLMAIQTARTAKLNIDPHVANQAMRFLDSVQSDRGAKYGYQVNQPTPTKTATAVGLLCRMHHGWFRNTSAVERGVEYLSSLGPSPDDVYFNYYATQVMHHAGGKAWQRWNAPIRDHLIATQAADGREFGSWHFNHRHGNVGGRLYSTALALLTLEVYYRHLRLYGDEAQSL